MTYFILDILLLKNKNLEFKLFSFFPPPFHYFRSVFFRRFAATWPARDLVGIGLDSWLVGSVPFHKLVFSVVGFLPQNNKKRVKI